MKKIDDELDQSMKDFLGALHPAPQRTEQAAESGRKLYLQQIDSYIARGQRPPAQEVNRWTFLRQKNFVSLALALAIVFVLLISGAGVAAAAQDTLPNQTLYEVKIFGENLHLALTNNSTTKFALLESYVQRRYDEIDALQAKTDTVPEGLAVRLEEQSRWMLQLAANMDDSEMEQSLRQMREMLQIQYQRTNNSDDQGQPGGNPDPVQARIRKTTRECWEAAVLGLSDPGQFRYKFAHSYKYAGEGPGDGTCTPTGESYGPGPGKGTGTPEEGGYGPGPYAGTATPHETGESYGPGPHAGKVTPQDAGESNGPGPYAGTATPQGTGESHGPGPQPTEQPGNKNGPGPSDSSTQEPIQKQHNK